MVLFSVTTMLPYCSLFSVGQYWSHFLWGKRDDSQSVTCEEVVFFTFPSRAEGQPTLPFSTRLVIMIMIPVFCSHTILQKSSNVDLRGPWAAMYALGWL